MAFGDVVGRQANAVKVSLDREVKIPRLGGLPGPLEVAFGLRLYVSIRFRHHVVKCLSFQMMYSSYSSRRLDFVNE